MKIYKNNNYKYINEKNFLKRKLVQFIILNGVLFLNFSLFNELTLPNKNNKQ
ncbi:MAG TPA: hypothetical protein GX747_04280, partial [Tenericutes bacterium]|nr:hypothetical protein [Mycoplasmatota bacterium]